MGVQTVLVVLAAWFVGSVLLGAVVGRMLRGKPPVIAVGLVPRRSRFLAA